MNKYILKIFTYLFIFLFSVNSYALDVYSHVPDNPKNALIFIHGWKQSGKDVLWMTDKFNKHLPDTAFSYPTAPDKALGSGYQWFEIPTIGEEMSQEETYDIMLEGALKNVSKVHEVIKNIHQTTNIPYENIYITGYSQGGLMALLTSITSPYPVSKAISFSGVPVILSEDKLDIVSNKPNILIIQGDSDRVIPANSYLLTEKSLNKLEIKYHTQIVKGLRHQITDDAIEQATSYIRE